MAKPITPIRAKYDYEHGNWIWGISEEDFKRVQTGYACARCLEGFDHYTKVCPVCGQKIDSSEILVPDLPSEWSG